MLLCCTRVWLEAKKIPFVLCGSRFAPAVAYSNSSTVFSSRPFDISVDRDGSFSEKTHLKFRKKKRLVFDALVRWCAANQYATLLDPNITAVHSLLSTSSMSEDNTNTKSGSPGAILHWLHSSTNSLSCGQSLLVCSFLLEVLLCCLEASPDVSGDTQILQEHTRTLVNRIAALLERATASDRLESQPLAILMSCVYGLHRLAASPNAGLGASERLLLALPAPLLFAALHQLRGNSLDALFDLDPRAAEDVCLSFLLIADEARRRAYMSGNDGGLVSRVLRRLMRHIGSSTREADEVDTAASTSDAALIGLADVFASTTPGKVSPSMGEVRVILENISFCRAEHRLMMMTHLLRVRRRPKQFTKEDIAVLPSILRTTADIRSHQARLIVTSLLRDIPLPTDAVTAARLVALAPSSALTPLIPVLESLGTTTLDPEDAAAVLRCAVHVLKMETVEHLISLAMTSEGVASTAETVVLSLIRRWMTVQHRNSWSSNKSHGVSNGSIYENNVVSVGVPSVGAGDAVLLTGEKKLEAERKELDILRNALSRVARRVNWTLESTPHSALRRLLAVTRLDAAGVTIENKFVVVETLSLLSLNLEGGERMIRTLSIVSSAIPCLADDAMRRRIVEEMIRYSGSRSSSSVIRFLTLLAPLAMRYKLRNSELVCQLLRMKTLNPAKLRNNGAQKGADMFTQFVINAVEFVLASEEWRTKTDEVRTAISEWTNDYLQYTVDVSLLKHTTPPHNIVNSQISPNTTPATTIRHPASSKDVPLTNDVATVVMRAPGADPTRAATTTTTTTKTTTTVTTSGTPIRKDEETVTAATMTREDNEVEEHDDEDDDDSETYPDGQSRGFTVDKSNNENINTNTNESDSPSTDVPTDEQLERVLLCALRAGSHIPDFLSSELSFRVQHMSCGSLLPPAHFVACCRLNIPLEIGLETDLLDELLNKCDCRVLHNVSIAFLKSFRRDMPPEQLPRAVNRAIELTLYRVNAANEETSDSLFAPFSASSVVANLLRSAIGFLTFTERERRSSRPPSVATETTGKANLNHINNSTITSSTVNKDNASSTADSTTESVEKDISLDISLSRALAHLSPSHTREMSLLLLDRLAAIAPNAAAFLMTRVATQLADLTPAELLQLARRYAPAGDVVIGELQGRGAIGSIAVDDFARVARDVPQSVAVPVLDALSPTLSFAWVVRLLSAVAARPALLPPLLARLDELSPEAQVGERHAAVIALRRCAEEGAAEMDDALRHQVNVCCEQMLDIANLADTEALTLFLGILPPRLREDVATSLTQHILSHIMPPIASDADALLALCQLLRRYQLLLPIICESVANSFFTNTVHHKTSSLSLPCSSSASASAAAAFAVASSSSSQDQPLTSSSSSSSDTVRVAPIATVLSLAVLLTEITGGTEGSAGCQALRFMQCHYNKVTERLAIAVALVDVRGAHSLAGDVCKTLSMDAARLTSSEFSRLLQCISRLRCWSHVEGIEFGAALRFAFEQADAHSRCVAFKALSTAASLFHAHEAFMMPLLRGSVDILAAEDLELLLTAVLNLPLTESLESLLDAIGTRLLPSVDQCRRSTLIRLLQCHAAFRLRDDALVERALVALEEQCGGRDARLEAAQVLTLLQAVVDLDVAIPERLAVACFLCLGHQVDNLNMAQLGHAARLAVDIEMGYTASVHAIVTRALEHREAMRANVAFREAAEMVCDEFSVEIPYHLRAIVMRRRYQTERMHDYFDIHKVAK